MREIRPLFPKGKLDNHWPLQVKLSNLGWNSKVIERKNSRAYFAAAEVSLLYFYQPPRILDNIDDLLNVIIVKDFIAKKTPFCTSHNYPDSGSR
jgi:hypothetical protein